MGNYFADKAWNDYIYWQNSDKKILNKINDLIEDVHRHGLNKGLGKPEPLKGKKEWSRRITQEHRLVYKLDSNGNVEIVSCKGHYDD